MYRIHPRAGAALARAVCAAVLLAAQAPPASASEAHLRGALATSCSSALHCFQRRLLPLDEYRAALAAESSTERARARALEAAQQTRSAIDTARRVLFWNRGVFDPTYARLARFEAGVAEAASPEAVAAELDRLLSPGMASTLAPGLDFDASCEYTTGEIIAIVIGLLLGIIPGLILLVLLC